MKKSRKKWVFAGVIVLLLAVAFFSVNLNRFKGRIESRATELLGQQVRIGGNIGFGFEGWMPAVMLRDVTIGKEKQEMTAASEKMAVGLLFSGNLSEKFMRFIVGLDDLSINGKPVGDYDFPIVFRDDGFEILGLKGKPGSGRLSGDVSYLEKKLSLDMKAQALDYGFFSKSLEGGDVKADIDLKSRGRTYEQLAQGLDGHFTLKGGKGKITDRDDHLWAGNLLATLLGRDADKKINCAVFDFKIKEGVAKSRMIAFDTEHMTVYGEGKIDFVKEKIDIEFTPKPKDLALINLATPVRMTGFFGDVKVSPVKAALLGKIGGAILANTLAPGAALLPLMTAGNNNDSCEELLKRGEDR